MIQFVGLFESQIPINVNYIQYCHNVVPTRLRKFAEQFYVDNVDVY